MTDINPKGSSPLPQPDDGGGIRLLVPPTTQENLVLPAQPEATGAEVKAATNSCVVHLCGCDA